MVSDLTEDLRAFMKRERLVFDDVYIEQSEMQRLAADAPAGFAGVATVDEDLAEVQLSPPEPQDGQDADLA